MGMPIASERKTNPDIRSTQRYMLENKKRQKLRHELFELFGVMEPGLNGRFRAIK